MDVLCFKLVACVNLMVKMQLCSLDDKIDSADFAAVEISFKLHLEVGHINDYLKLYQLCIY